jgi:RNA polymerase sigma-70 factor, ECF subfamily
MMYRAANAFPEASQTCRRVGLTATPDTSKHREHQLITKSRAGDRAAMRELIDLHKDRLFAFIWRMVRDHHETEDICQDAFLKAFASLNTFSSEFRFSTWLFTIGYRVCLNRLRRKRGTSTEIDFTAMPSLEGSDSEEFVASEEAGKIRGLVWDAVDQLSPPQRAAVLLFYRHEFGCHEIARVLEVPLATVKSHLHRARARLREILESNTAGELNEFRNFSERAV